MIIKKRIKGNAWVGLLILLTFLTVIGLALIAEITTTITQSKRAAQVLAAQALCDAGVEKAIWKLNQGQSYEGEAMETGNLTVTILDDGPETKIIEAVATVPLNNPKVRRRVRAKVQATPNEENVAFRYALHAGEGGIEISGGPTIFGNLYSNAGVTFTGNSHRVTGDVMAHTTITPNPNPRVNGTMTVGVPIVPLPSVNIDSWRSYAEAGGIITGNYTASGTSSLGPKKIQGSFSMSATGATLNLTGPLYVTGNFNMSGGRIVLSDTFGSKGTVIIVDGKISIGGGASFLKNSAGGNILIVSTSSANDAIVYSGSSSTEGLSLYAPNGGMTLSGSGQIVATCGKTLYISGNGDIRYQSGLANNNFSAGPGGSYEIKEWQILP
jgi:hypothetical protein